MFIEDCLSIIVKTDHTLIARPNFISYLTSVIIFNHLKGYQNMFLQQLILLMIYLYLLVILTFHIII